ncbi:MAG: thermonuclease family protein [Patescibacteria group bacterium]|nr:thermonuclease family protein [Patescibacteria group bacterium]
MFLKNKTLLLLIIGFVFLFLASRAHFGADQKITAKQAAGADAARAELSRQNLIATDSESITPPASPGSAPISRGELKSEYYPVAKVVDGDTIDIIINGKTERLRLIGINTPEVVDPRKPVECFGREASDNAKKLLTGAEVRISADPSQDDRDIYGRLLRYVWRADGLFYNLAAIHDGFAYEYTYKSPYQYQREFKDAQKFAQDNFLGLWAQGACRKGNQSAGRGAGNNPAAEVKAADSGCLIKGNIGSTGDKIYHLPGCPYYNQTVIDESKGEKWFCTEAEALAAGWRKAKNCP